MNVTTRSAATEARYEADLVAGRTRPLKDIPSIQEWPHWRLVENDYPGDMLYKIHHMLVAKEKVAERFDLSKPAQKELELILEYFVYPKYSCVIENCPKYRTVPEVYHLHLVKFYDSREEIRL